MHEGKSVFSQILDFLPKYTFDRIVALHEGNKGVRSFSCWDHLLCLIFAQLTGRESVRDIEVCMCFLGAHLTGNWV
jgi:hypothetical protein